MEEITAEDSDKYLVSELRGSDWELEYVEVDSDEHPQKMAYGWLGNHTHSVTKRETSLSRVMSRRITSNHVGGLTQSSCTLMTNRSGC